MNSRAKWNPTTYLSLHVFVNALAIPIGIGDGTMLPLEYIISLCISHVFTMEVSKTK